MKLFSFRVCFFVVFFFFFQAEDGIRDYKVTGVQTCALPISVISFPKAIVKFANDLEKHRRTFQDLSSLACIKVPRVCT